MEQSQLPDDFEFTFHPVDGFCISISITTATTFARKLDEQLIIIAF
jgi:hypothetical protein